MAKDAINFINTLELEDKSKENINKLLSEGKTLVLPIEIGKFVAKSLEAGFSEYYNANIELKEMKDNIGLCGCGNPNNALIWAWRD